MVVEDVAEVQVGMDQPIGEWSSSGRWKST
jgi:hypothetical protein